MLKELIVLIKERLSYMEHVAVYKWRNRLPIIDVKSGNYVIEHVRTTALQAQMPYLDLISEIFKLQIDLAVIVQERWFEFWSMGGFRDSYDKLDLFETIFPKIISIGDKQLPIISHLKSVGEVIDKHELSSLLMSNIIVHHIKSDDLDQLRDFIITHFSYRKSI